MQIAVLKFRVDRTTYNDAMDTSTKSLLCEEVSQGSQAAVWGPGPLQQDGSHLEPSLPQSKSPDFFLWGYLKDRVYKDNPRTLDALKAAITAEISAIAPATCRKFMENFKKRAQVCFERQGRHLEHVIKRAGH